MLAAQRRSRRERMNPGADYLTIQRRRSHRRKRERWRPPRGASGTASAVCQFPGDERGSPARVGVGSRRDINGVGEEDGRRIYGPARARQGDCPGPICTPHAISRARGRRVRKYVGGVGASCEAGYFSGRGGKNARVVVLDGTPPAARDWACAVARRARAKGGRGVQHGVPTGRGDTHGGRVSGARGRAGVGVRGRGFLRDFVDARWAATKRRGHRRQPQHVHNQSLTPASLKSDESPPHPPPRKASPVGHPHSRSFRVRVAPQRTPGPARHPGQPARHTPCATAGWPAPRHRVSRRRRASAHASRLITSPAHDTPRQRESSSKTERRDRALPYSPSASPPGQPHRVDQRARADRSRTRPSSLALTLRRACHVNCLC